MSFLQKLKEFIVSNINTAVLEADRDIHLQLLPEVPAHRITSDAEAIEAAHRLAAEFAREASARDRERRLPVDELNAFSQSGLWAITVPKEYGGAGVSWRTLTEVIRIISAVDPSLGQLPQNHLVIVEHIRLDGSEEQKRFFFDLVLNGVRFGNAFSERGNQHVADFKTVIKPDGEGFEVALIPHTVANTAFAATAVGSAVNLEIDLVARYVERLLGARVAVEAAGGEGAQAARGRGGKSDGHGRGS